MHSFSFEQGTLDAGKFLLRGDPNKPAQPAKRARTDERIASNPLADVARELAEEKRKRALAEAQRSRKILFLGDVRGQFDQAFTLAATQDQKNGPFEAVFCVGAFLPESELSQGDVAATYLKGVKGTPKDCYFIDASPALLQAAPAGMTLGQNMHFLGAYGLRSVCGIRVAFLSGTYDEALYDTLDVDFIGGAYTKRTVNKLKKLVHDSHQGVDVLLTVGWPANITKHLTDPNHQPPEVPTVESWQLSCAPPVAEICQAIEPRYHIFGSANIFYQRQPFQTTRYGHACRCIGLGAVGSPLSKQQKWIHALALSPMEHMSQVDLKKQAVGSTASPLTENTELLELGEAAGVPDNAELLKQALDFLADGDLQQYLDVAKQLERIPFNCK